jgi:hypothetical protein
MKRKKRTTTNEAGGHVCARFVATRRSVTLKTPDFFNYCLQPTGKFHSCSMSLSMDSVVKSSVLAMACEPVGGKEHPSSVFAQTGGERQPHQTTQLGAVAQHATSAGTGLPKTQPMKRHR